MEFCRRFSDAFLDFWRFRELQQFLIINLTCFGADLRAYFPLTHFLSFAQRGTSKRETNAIVRQTKIFRCLGHTIRRQPFRQTRIIPIGIQHEWRPHHYSTAPVKPLLLLARSWQPGRIHERDLPLELDAAVVTLLQFRPCGLRPETPG